MLADFERFDPDCRCATCREVLDFYASGPVTAKNLSARQVLGEGAPARKLPVHIDVYDSDWPDIPEVKLPSFLILRDECMNETKAIVLDFDPDGDHYVCRHPGQHNRFKVPYTRITDGTAREVE